MSNPLERELELEAAAAPSRRRAWLRRLTILALCFFAAYVIVSLIGQIDWSEVWDALGHLAWWQLVVLFVALLVRQTLNAVPLAFFIPGLSVYRAVVNDLAAHLLAVVAPPPGDLVLRVSMFTSWGIKAARAVAGSLMNVLAFYLMRFSVPIIGFAILLPVRFDSGYAVAALLGALVAGAIAGLVVLGLRSAGFAARIGRTAGSFATKVRRGVDPGSWGAATMQFRLDMKDTFAAGFPPSVVALVGLVFADATVLLLSLRFVGVSAAELPAIELYAAFLCVYPLTLFPFMGLGIVDAVLLATFVEVGGIDVEPPAVAALLVWRAFTLAGPIGLGAVCMALWRHSVARESADPAVPSRERRRP